MAREPAGVRSLVLGVNGQVGGALPKAMSRLGTVVSLDRSQADLAKPSTLRDVVRSHAPQVVVNAAAYTAVDKAEDEAELAHCVNAVAPGEIAAAASAVGAAIVHYSIDYVFDGTKSSAYVETDATNPLSAYGRSKLGGERSVAAATPRHIVFRTSWVFGERGTNFLRTILQLAADREQMTIVADQHGVPTSAHIIASVTATVVAQMLNAGADDPRWGIYNLAPAGRTTWHAYAKRAIAGATARGARLKAATDEVLPITAAEYPVRAIRPANSMLDTPKLRSTFPVSLPDWTQGVDHVLGLLIPS